MFCTGCGSGLPESARFCPRCGKAATAADPAVKCLSCQTSLPPGKILCPACGAEHQYCPHCGALALKTTTVCGSCRGVVAAVRGPYLSPREYEHPSMQSVNKAMRRSPIFNATAEMVSKKLGKRWYESTFTSIPVTQRQYQRLHHVAEIGAARLGLRKIPSVYVESSRGYASATYGSKNDAFVNIGSFLLRLLKDNELLFVVGHEYGHLVGDHALWTTVTTFTFGEHRSSLMAGGIFGLMSPTRLMSAGVEAVITNWMRIADFTADRVGLLTAGDFDTARRALFLLYQKNRADLAEVDLDEWMRQQAEDEPHVTKITQLMTSGAPYLGVRLNELKKFYESPQYREARDKLDASSGVLPGQLFDEQGTLKRTAKPPGLKEPALPQAANARRTPARGPVLRCACPACRRRLSVPAGKLTGHDRVTVTCPACKRRFVLRLGRPSASPATKGAAEHPPSKKTPAAPGVRAVRSACPGCGKVFAIRLDKLSKKPYADIRCNGCRRPYRLSLVEARAAMK